MVLAFAEVLMSARDVYKARNLGAGEQGLGDEVAPRQDRIAPAVAMSANFARHTAFVRAYGLCESMGESSAALREVANASRTGAKHQ